MHRILSGILCGSLLALGLAIAHAEPAPVGAHDPEAITCNAPQLVPISNARGWGVCVQNEMLDGFAAGSLVNLPMVDRPTGVGDPAAITCRARQDLTGSRIMGPETCARNSFWAKLTENGCALSPGSRAIIHDGTTKVLRPLACSHIQGRNGVMPPTFF